MALGPISYYSLLFFMLGYALMYFFPNPAVALLTALTAVVALVALALRK